MTNNDILVPVFLSNVSADHICWIFTLFFLQFHISLGSLYDSMSWWCCAYGLVRFRHTRLGLGKDHVLNGLVLWAANAAGSCPDVLLKGSCGSTLRNVEMLSRTVVCKAPWPAPPPPDGKESSYGLNVNLIWQVLFFMVSFPVLFWNCPSPIIPPSVFPFFASVYLLLIPSSVSVCSFCSRSCLRQFVPCCSELLRPSLTFNSGSGVGRLRSSFCKKLSFQFWG